MRRAITLAGMLLASTAAHATIGVCTLNVDKTCTPIPVPVPEPISIALLGIGLAGIGLARVSYARRRPRH